MTMRFEEIPGFPGLPESYVMIAVYGGTSSFPLTTFLVLECWWQAFKLNPEVSFTDKAVPEVLPPSA